MSDEDAFQAALDANPDDANCRLVFADWLEERDDPRAEGMRALAVRGWEPFRTMYVTERFTVGNYPATGKCDYSTLPDDWLDGVWEAAGQDHRIEIGRETGEPNGNRWCSFATRRECEDAAALAFSRLPLKRRAELLSPPVPA